MSKEKDDPQSHSTHATSSPGATTVSSGGTSYSATTPAPPPADFQTLRQNASHLLAEIDMGEAALKTEKREAEVTDISARITELRSQVRAVSGQPTLV